MYKNLIVIVMMGVMGILFSCTPSKDSRSGTDVDNEAKDGVSKLDWDNSACASLSLCVGKFMSVETLCSQLYLWEHAGESIKAKDSVLRAFLGEVGSMMQDNKRPKDCDTIKAEQFTLSKSEQEQCQAGKKSFCEGNTMVRCSGFKVDCSKLGLKCMSYKLGGERAKCVEGSCEAGTRRCKDKNTLSVCNYGLEMYIYCPIYEYVEVDSEGSVDDPSAKTTISAGGICSEQGDRARCVGDGPVCDKETFKARCDGDILVSCNNGHEARMDCRLLGLKCEEYNGSVFCGVSNECNPYAFTSTCKDGKVTYCLWGAIDTVDCKAFGGSGCKHKEQGSYCTK